MADERWRRTTPSSSTFPNTTDIADGCTRTMLARQQNFQHQCVNKVVYHVVGYYVTRSVQIVGFFDVAARLCAGDGPIAA